MVLGFVHIRRFDEKHGYVHIEQQLPVMAGEFVGRAAGTAAAARPAERAVGTVECGCPPPWSNSAITLVCRPIGLGRTHVSRAAWHVPDCQAGLLMNSWPMPTKVAGW